MAPRALHRAIDRLPPPARRHVRNALEIATNAHGERTPIARDYLYRAVAPLTPSFEIASGDARFVLNTADMEISRILFTRREYDRPLLVAVHDLLTKLHGRPFTLAGATFMDIGANLGSATVEALVHFGAERGLAFEPDAVNFAFLQRNLAANGLLERVDAHRVALSDREGEVTFELAPENAGDHRVRLDAPLQNSLGEAGRELVSVPATTLDALAGRGAVDLSRVGLAWIDVQGHEPNVLEGASALCESHVPIVIEYWPYGLRAAGALERFDDLVGRRFTHVLDTRRAGGDPERGLLDAGALTSLHEVYRAPEQHTDLILLRG